MKKESNNDDEETEIFTGILDLLGQPIFKYIKKIKKPPAGFGRMDEW